MKRLFADEQCYEHIERGGGVIVYEHASHSFIQHKKPLNSMQTIGYFSLFDTEITFKDNELA